VAEYDFMTMSNGRGFMKGFMKVSNGSGSKSVVDVRN
jgi:hypothetical protein